MTNDCVNAASASGKHDPRRNQAVAADDYASWKQHTGGETKHGVESRAAVGQRGADAVRALVTDSAYSDSMPTTLMLVTHGSWITAAISNLLELDPTA